MAGTNLIERLEHELVAQTAALDSLLNAGGKRGRKQAHLPLTPNQVGLLIAINCAVLQQCLLADASH